MKSVRSVLCILLFFLLLGFGNITFTSTKEALTFWFETLVPSMFVSMLFIRIIHDQRMLHRVSIPLLPRLLHIEPSVFSLVLCAMLLGFPNGALFIEQAYVNKEIDQKGATRLLYTCSFATPSFIIMSCGLVLYHSLFIGFLLFITQLCSGFVLLLFTRNTAISNFAVSFTHPSLPFMQSISQAIIESGKALYMIGGYLMLFMSISNILYTVLPHFITFPLQLLGEFSNGILSLQYLPLSFIQSIALCSFLLSFAGFCVHMQIMSMLTHLRISYLKFLFFRILQGMLSVFFLLLLLMIFTNS